MTKEKFILIFTTLFAFASIATAGYLFADSQKKDLQIKSLEGKHQQTQAAALKSDEILAAKEKRISELTADLEKSTSEKADTDIKVKSFALQAAACEAFKTHQKKH